MFTATQSPTSHPRGFVSIVVIVFVAIIALATAGAAVWVSFQETPQPSANENQNSGLTNSTSNRNTSVPTNANVSFSCEDYRYGTCPTGCVKRCVPSTCSGGVCTADCGGAGSCVSLDAAGWRTYTSSEHGYTLRYPPNWSTAEETGQAYQAVGKQLILTNFDPNTAPGRELIGDEKKYVVSVQDTSNTFTVVEYVEKLKRDPGFSFGNITKETTTTVDAYPAYRIESTSLGTVIQTYWWAGGKIFLLTGYSGIEVVSAVYDEILSSFRLSN